MKNRLQHTRHTLAHHRASKVLAKGCLLTLPFHHARRDSTRTAASASNDLPQDWTQVRLWAKERFRRLASSSRADDKVWLAQACLMIALEEEACVEAHPEIQELLMQQTDLRLRSVAGAATWSLSRLDALAAQVKALILTHPDQPTASAVSASPTHLNTDNIQGSSSQDRQHAGQQVQDGSTGEAAALEQVVQGSEASALSDHQQDGEDEGATWGSGGRAGHRSDLSEMLNEAVADSAPDTPSTSSAAGGGDSTQATAQQGAGSAASLQLPPGLFESEPLRVLDAINRVLFEWHGYGPSNRYGNPRDSHLSSVLERGLGCSPALSILYMQLASRLGIKLAAHPLEEGRYWVLWPVDHPHILNKPVHTTQQEVLQATAQEAAQGARGQVQEEQQHQQDAQGQEQVQVQVQAQEGLPAGGSSASASAASPTGPCLEGNRLVIDPYGGGSLLAVEEVCELFGVSPQELSRPADPKALVACLLSDLLDAYWAKAVGCSPAPGVMLPLTLDTALQNKVAGAVNVHAMGRALAAAEKITWLMPENGSAQLKFSLLHFFARNWDDCWIELGLYLERSAAAATATASSTVPIPTAAVPSPAMPLAPSTSASGDPDNDRDGDGSSVQDVVSVLSPATESAALLMHSSSRDTTGAGTGDGPGEAIAAEAAASSPGDNEDASHGLEVLKLDQAHLPAASEGLVQPVNADGQNLGAPVGYSSLSQDVQLAQVLLEKVRLQLVLGGA